MVDAWQTVPGIGDIASDQAWHDENLTRTRAKVKPFGPKAVIIQGLSQDVHDRIPDNLLGFVFIDGGHQYSEVYDDLKNYTTKVRIGGIVAGHDFLNKAYGVRDAATQFCRENGYKLQVFPDRSELDAGFFFIKTD